MAVYEVNIPEERLAFILELFNRLEFVSYQVAKAEPRVYIAQEIIQKHSEAEKTKETEETEAPYDREAELKKIRETIEHLHKARPSEIARESKLKEQETVKVKTKTRAKTKIKTEVFFRFPNGDDESAQTVEKYDDLLSIVENYFRTKVARIEFNKAGKDKKFKLDQFVVMAVLLDKNNEETKLKAGYISSKLK